MQKLLGINTNYKTIKSEKVGVLTGIIYMAPYNLSGKNVCPGASAGCAAACLKHGRARRDGRSPDGATQENQ
jgi:hypothetical protein